MFSLLYQALLLIAGGASAFSSACQNVKFTVSGTAQNLNITGIPLGSLDAVRAFASTASFFPVSGSQTLAGTYCEPTVNNPDNSGKLQVLVPPINSNRDWWSALGGTAIGFPAYRPERYSWTRFANAEGYATLAIDRLGSGLSSHPDPILVTQAPYEVELYTDLANQIRTGSSALGTAYKHLVYVGNLDGSQIGAAIAGSHPSAYDEYVVTGYSKDILQSQIGVDLTLPAPAALVEPARFGTLSLGYEVATSEIGLTNSFFGSKDQVSFDKTLAKLLFQRKDSVGLGQVISIYIFPYIAHGFKGRVLTLTGEQDQAFCGFGSPLLGRAQCGPILAETRVKWPDAEYNWKSIDRTGLAIPLHNSAQTSFSIAHQFLAGQTFQGGPPA